MKKILLLSLLIALVPVLTFATFDKDLMFGAKGQDVKKLQIFLISKGNLKRGSATGNYGYETVKAVKKYQIDNNLPAVGVLNQATRNSINQTSKNVLKAEADNFSEVISLAYKKQSELFDSYINELVKPMIDYVANDLNQILSTRNATSRLEASETKDRLMAIYDLDIKFREDAKKLFEAHKNRFEYYSNLLKSQSTAILQKQTTREESISLLRQINEDRTLTDIKNKFDADYNNYISSRQTIENSYNNFFQERKNQINTDNALLLLQNYRNQSQTPARIYHTNCYSLVGNSFNCTTR